MAAQLLVAGIDISTRAIDLVLVPVENNAPPMWHRFELTGQDAWERARSVRMALPGRTSQLWDEVLAFGVEDPRGINPGPIFRVQGALLACLPSDALVHPLVPSQWRKLNELNGNASKQAVRLAAIDDYPEFVDWPQDACDAYCIAQATRQLLEQQEAA